MITLNIASEYTKTPGGRYLNEGEFSGEDFREQLLIPRFQEAVSNNEVLQVNLDGGYGYGSSFLEEAFGGLIRRIGKIDINLVHIISDEEPQLVYDVRKYMEEAIAFLGDKRNAK